MAEIQLPEGWVWRTLQTLGRWSGGGTPSKARPEFWLNGTVSWVIPKDMKSMYIRETEDKITTDAVLNSTAKYILPTSILFVVRSGILRRTLPIVLAIDKATVNQDIKILSLNNGCSPEYIYYYLKCINQQLLQTCSKAGTTVESIETNLLKQVKIPLPPLPVQQAIVARIEELFSVLEAGTRELQTALDRLKIYRQAVLHRYLNNPDWERGKWGEVAEMRLKKMLDEAKNKGTAQPYLRNINVRWGTFNLSDLLEMRFEPNEEDRYGLVYGDLIVCEGGEPGRAAIWKGQQVGMKIQKALHRIRFQPIVKVEFFYYYLIGSALNGYLAQYFTGTTIKHLTGREFAKFEFPLPNLTTQTQIVAEIEARLSEADAMENTIRQELARAENLRQSILKQAFEGKLVSAVSEEPDEEEAAEVAEPASPVFRNRHAEPSGEQLRLF